MVVVVGRVLGVAMVAMVAVGIRELDANSVPFWGLFGWVVDEQSQICNRFAFFVSVGFKWVENGLKALGKEWQLIIRVDVVGEGRMEETDEEVEEDEDTEQEDTEEDTEEDELSITCGIALHAFETGCG